HECAPDPCVPPTFPFDRRHPQPGTIDPDGLDFAPPTGGQPAYLTEFNRVAGDLRAARAAYEVRMREVDRRTSAAEAAAKAGTEAAERLQAREAELQRLDEQVRALGDKLEAFEARSGRRRKGSGG